MNIGVLLPGFSGFAGEYAIPVQEHLIDCLSARNRVRVLALRYPYKRGRYTLGETDITSLGWAQANGRRRLALWMDALWALRSLHREQPFHVLHATWADETGALAVWGGRMLGIPSVVSVVGGELVRLGDIGYGLQGSVYGRWVVRQSLKANAVIASSGFLARLMTGLSFFVPATRLHPIPLGVDSDCFTPNVEPPDPYHLITVGSLIAVKDHAMLIRAMARLCAPPYSLPVTLELIGEGDEKVRLQSLAAEIGIEHAITFADMVSHLDLPAHYQRAALHVLPSRHEGQGMVTLEAAACGVPTVGTAVGILVDDPDLGVAVPVGDETALVNAIAEMLNHSDLRRAWGERARRAVEMRYTLAHTARRLQNLYEQLACLPQ